MSNELTKARQHLTQVRGLLRRGKIMPAAQAFHDALLLVLKNPLLKGERDEFERMLTDAAAHLANDPELRKVFPLKIDYRPGEERQVLDTVRELVKTLNEAAVDEAQEHMKLLEARKTAALERGQSLLDAGDYDAASGVFRQLVSEFSDDPALKGDIGERFLKAGRYEEAFEYLAQALEQSPESVHLYNRIGIALRKMGKFEVAEKYYFKAARYTGRDPNLFFNIGRLYVDWRKWNKVAKAASAALQLKPDFDEARKMLEFATRQLDDN